MLILAAVIAGILGLAFGSFINVVAYRVPLGRSVIRPPSACPACGALIAARDNIPVLSWFLLHGKCRSCGASISARYPLVEGLTAILFAGVVAVIGVHWVLPAYLLFVGVTLTLILTDLDHQRIPNRILYPSTIAGVVLLGAGALLDAHGAGFLRALVGGLAYFGVLFLLALVARGGFGFGDVKLAFLLGLFAAYRTWGSLWVAVFLAFLIGGAVALILLITRQRGRKDHVPFGPALVLGAWIAVAAGPQIVSWYLG